MDDSLRWARDESGDITAVICAECCEWVLREELWVDPDGITWDVCTPCGGRSLVASVLLWMANPAARHPFGG